MQDKIAIIGGSGFIGSRLTKRLLESGHYVKIIDKIESKTYPNLWVKADIRDKSALIDALNGCNIIYNLAAEHRDDVKPQSLYYEVNVKGAKVLCEAAEELMIKKIIFTSSVSVYGFSKRNLDESAELNPFNDYGRSKLEAEKIYQAWQVASPDRTLTIFRLAVVFGEGNRGNVYNLLYQIANGYFIMVGSGKNIKSMAYVENVAALLEYALQFDFGYYLFNVVDKPDLDMNTLVSLVKKELKIDGKVGFRIPYTIGYLCGMFFDLIARLTGRRFPISAIRIKKFCSNTQFSSSRIKEIGFVPPYSLEEGLIKTIRYEFPNTNRKNKMVFYTE